MSFLIISTPKHISQILKLGNCTFYGRLFLFFFAEVERYFWHTYISPNSNSTLPSGHEACGNDLAAQCAPAHYTLHHLHITWRDNTCWSFSRRFKQVQQGSFIETIKTALLQRLFPNCTTVELQCVSLSNRLCSFVVSVCPEEAF